MTDPQVKVQLTLDAKQYEQSLKSASKHTAAVDESIKKTQKSAGRAKSDWSAMGAAITVAGGMAVVAMKKAVDAASNLNESTTKMRTIFGAASKEIERFASTSATSLGMSKQAAMDAASMMATFGKAAGLTGSELTSFSTDMVTLSGDLASFFNSSPDEAMTAIGAALRGESEPIRRYGVLLDDATLRNRALEMGIISNVKNALTPQQKALAAQKEILAQTSDAQGDFARTSDGLANSQRIMEASMQDASAALGESLLPVMTKGVKAVTAVAEAFGNLPGPVRDTAAGLALTAAAVAALAPAASVAIKGVKSLAEGLAVTTTATDGLTAASGRLSGAGGLIGLAKALGVVGVAIASIQAVRWTGGLLDDRRINEVADGFARAAAAGQSLGDAFAVESVSGAITTIEKALQVATSDLPQYAAAQDQVRQSFEGLDAYLSSLSPDMASAEFGMLADRVTAAGGSVADLNGLLPTYSAAVKTAAGASGEQADAEKLKADAIKAANDAQQKAIDILTGYINSQLAAAGSADALLGAQDRLTKAHKSNGDALTGSTAKAVENRDALRSEIGMVLSNAQAKVDAAKASGKDTVAAYEIGNAAIKKGKAALVDAAVAAGYSRDEVEKLISKYMKVPKDIRTDIQATGVTAAQDAARAYKNLIDSIPAEKRTKFIGIYNKVNANPGMNKAGGGKVVGPGTGTSDSIPAMLSNGEWVIPADVAGALGDGFMARLVEGRVAGFAAGGKVTAAAAKRKAAAEARKRAAAKKKAAAAAKSRRGAALDDIEWQYDMDLIDLPTKIAKLQKQLKSRTGQEAKDLQLTIHQAQGEYRSQQEDAAAAEQQRITDEQEKAAEAAQRAAEAAQKAAEDQQAAADALKARANDIAQGIVGALSLSQTQANGKKWTSSAMLGDFANRAQKARDFATMVADLSARGLSEDVISQVLAAGPVAGADMARALSRMSATQIGQVNASQGAINASGQWLGNALTYGAANAITVNLSGGAPVVLQLDSRAIYEGQLELRRQMGGSYALVPR